MGVITLFGALLVASHAMADVTIIATQKGKGMMGGLVSGDSVTRIKGGKMRVDGTVGDSPTSTLIDLDAQTMSALNHKTKEATITDLRELQATMRKLTDNSVKATVTPTGRRQEVAGQGCEEYRIDMTVPATVDPAAPHDGHHERALLHRQGRARQGRLCRLLPRGRREGAHHLRGPAAGQGQPGQSKSMTELYRQMARLGVPYAIEMDFKFGGEGPMGALMGKVGAFEFSSTVTRVSVEAIPDAVMTVPADYQVVKKN